MPKLDDTQLTILTRAAQRQDRAIATLDKRAVTRDAVTSLLKQKLLATVPKTPDHALWERDKSGQLLGLVITSKGLKAINAEGDDSALASKDAPSSLPAASAPRKSAAGKRKTGDAPTDAKPQPVRRAGSKLDAIIKLMRRPKGASIKQMMAETGWQPHSVRGAISGAIKKKLGLEVTSAKTEAGRIYRIVAA
mgnify:CR=1 FL=1